MLSVAHHRGGRSVRRRLKIRLQAALVAAAVASPAVAACSSSPSAADTKGVVPSSTASPVTPAPGSTPTPRITAKPGPPLPAFANPQGAGNYAVGRRTFVITDSSRQRTITVDAWYPAPLASAKGKPLSRYEPSPGLSYPAHMAVDNLPAAKGRFPVMLFSHGKPTIRYQSSFLMEDVASFGFVVLAPDHPGSTGLNDYLPVSTDLIERSRDLTFLLNQVAADAGGLASTIDMSRVASSGHSLGAYTAMALPIGADPGVPADTRIKAVVRDDPDHELPDRRRNAFHRRPDPATRGDSG